MDYQILLDEHKKLFETQKTKSYDFRLKQLIKLKEAIISNELKIQEALFKDLGKSYEESFLTEISVVLSDLDYTIKQLKKWMKPRRVKTPLMLFPAKSKIIKEPYGTVLIISPWNYPFQLTINPLIGAIAAGNTTILKPSPLSIHTTQIMKEIITKHFDDNYISCIEGDIDVANKLLDLKTDYIFFTGSSEAGKKIMEKASKHLIPVTLELGGKSPVILDETFDVNLAAKRIAFGKLINAGQTCIAPDYLLIKEDLVDEFIKNYLKHIKDFYTSSPLENEKYPNIISTKHLERQKSLIESHHQVFGGKFNDKKIEPTLLLNVELDDKIMQEEIFGPILPIIPFKSLDEAIKIIKSKDKPLALYHFSNDKKSIKKVIEEVSFGGATINDTLMHFANHNLPFGGVGMSGIGAYHGKLSFETFSHDKPVLFRGKIDLKLRYQPISEKSMKIIRKFTK